MGPKDFGTDPRGDPRLYNESGNQTQWDQEKRKFPAHWGKPPQGAQTKDLRELPGGFGQGSSTLAGWTRKQMTTDNMAKANGGIGGRTGKLPKGTDPRLAAKMRQQETRRLEAIP